MVRFRLAARLALFVAAAAVIAAACGSDDGRTVREDGAGAGGESHGGDSSRTGGSQSSPGGGDAESGGDGDGGVAALRGGAPPGGGGAAGGDAASDGGDSSGAEAGASGAAGAAGAGADGAAGAAGAGPDFGVPTEVEAYGCFIHSGDGGDLLPNGEIAVNVTSSVYSAACDSAWVSSNENAYAPQQTPTTLVMRRSFVVDPSLGAGDFTITYKADDAIDFLLNGQLIIGCSAPDDNPGLCQQVCNTSAMPAAAFNPPGVVNTLEARLINTFSVPAGGENYGYTALNYSVCVAQPPE
jgi:hypothetical protein